MFLNNWLDSEIWFQYEMRIAIWRKNNFKFSYQKFSSRIKFKSSSSLSIKPWKNARQFLKVLLPWAMERSNFGAFPWYNASVCFENVARPFLVCSGWWVKMELCGNFLAKFTFLLIYLCFTGAYSPPSYSPCHSMTAKYGIVCVCTEMYCDGFTKSTSPLVEGEFAVYTSSASGERFRLDRGKFRKPKNDTRASSDVLTLNVDSSTFYQHVMGYGGAFTGMIWPVLFKAGLVTGCGWFVYKYTNSLVI